MAKFPEAEKRLFFNKFVCRKCKSVMRSPSLRVVNKLLKCRDCASRHFKPKRKK